MKHNIYSSIQYAYGIVSKRIPIRTVFKLILLSNIQVEVYAII